MQALGQEKFVRVHSRHLTSEQDILYMVLAFYRIQNNYHLFTETEGNSVFCGPETAVVTRGEAEGNNGCRGGHKTHSFPEVSVNKCFVI
jgi:hypothetical protein